MEYRVGGYGYLSGVPSDEEMEEENGPSYSHTTTEVDHQALIVYLQAKITESQWPCSGAGLVA